MCVVVVCACVDVCVVVVCVCVCVCVCGGRTTHVLVSLVVTWHSSSSPLPVPLEDEEEDGLGLGLSRLLVSVLSTAASLKSDVFSATVVVQTRVSVLLVLSSLVHTTGETLQTQSFTSDCLVDFKAVSDRSNGSQASGPDCCFTGRNKMNCVELHED